MLMLAACEEKSPEQPTLTIWGCFTEVQENLIRISMKNKKVSSVSSKYAKGKAALSADVS